MASAHLVKVVLILAMAAHSASGANWCICKEGVGEGTMQKALDYACGNGADCSVTHQNGACYNPNTVRAHCNYAVNSYFQKKGQATGSCDFAGTATVVTNDPSTAGCAYPASASAVSTNTPTTGTTPTLNNPTTGTTPLITTPTGGTGAGGINNGLGPSGNGINTDGIGNDGGITVLMKKSISSITLTLCSFTTFLALLSWWA